MSCNACPQIIEASQTLTPCECKTAGYCNLHKMMKVPHFHMLCRTNIGYFEQYETGNGPGQNFGPPTFHVGLGDVAAWLIRVVTFCRVVPCNGCNSRKAWLNRVRLWPIRRKVKS